MNFLFLADEFYPTFGANSLVVSTVCRQLTTRGHTVWVMPAHYDPALPQEEVWEGIHIRRGFPADTKQSLIAALRKGHLWCAAGVLTMLVGAKLSGPHRLWHKQGISARRYLEAFIRQQAIDTVVSIHCSAELSLPLLHLRQRGRLSARWLFYMLDPFESHEYYRTHHSVAYLRRMQHRIMTACDGVLATDLIRRDTALWETEAVLNKIKVTEFPKIQQPRYCPCDDSILPDPRYTHVVCTGSKNETVRNSAFTLALCRRMEHLPIHFHFVGHGWTEDGVCHQEGNCFFYPPHSPTCAVNLQLDGDFLLNIGNNVPNQLPSKILEYISTGKPIIHIAKREDCPATALLTDWDALILNESEEMSSAQTRLSAYLSAEHPARSFEETEKQFAIYTPAHVVNLFVN
ncbi:MAG: hypothetical protein IKU51_02775 [Clostridia bacterium]|nr:hypothetical protein [Clostridia bacterium]